MAKFISPRCNPAGTDDVPVDSLRNFQDRWRHMSELAGSHQQEDSILVLNRPIEPLSFQNGLPSQVAMRIETLQIIPQENNLPEWLDVLSRTCMALQHLVVLPRETNPEAARMRRLYILYRLPDLNSIDEILVTHVERQLARPDTPNGERVNPKDWIMEERSSWQYDSDSDDGSIRSDTVELSFYGVIKRIAADPPNESFDEPALEKPYLPKDGIGDIGIPLSISTVNVNHERKNFDVSNATVTLHPRNSTISSSQGCLNSFGTMPDLCSRNEKYLPLEDQSFIVENPHWLASRVTGSHSVGRQDVEVECSLDRSVRLTDNESKSSSENSYVSTPTRSEASSTKAMAFMTSSVIDATVESPEKKAKVSPSHSLTSPFPMKFRSSTVINASPIQTTLQTIDIPPIQKISDLQRNPPRPKGARPPPCPGRLVIPVVESAHVKRQQRILGRLRKRILMRSTAVIDNESESDEDDDEDEEEGQFHEV
jgi:hypothetical protein